MSNGYLHYVRFVPSVFLPIGYLRKLWFVVINNYPTKFRIFSVFRGLKISTSFHA